MWLLSASNVASATEEQISTQSAPPGANATAPGISAPEVGLAPALLRLEGGAHSRGRPPWVAALSTPAGSPLSETPPFMGIFRLQDRPS